MLFTLPLFAWLRYVTPYCGRVDRVPLRCDVYPTSVHLLRDGSWHYAFWQSGLPPQDYWSLGLALLGAAAMVELAIIFRSRRSG